MSPIRGVPTTILVAPDSFKGTLTAAQVAQAIGRGCRPAGREVDLCPVADGGEGTLAALAGSLGAREQRSRSAIRSGARSRRRSRSATATAVVETAAASGLHLVGESERDPLAASTAGTGRADRRRRRGRGADDLSGGRGQRHDRRRRRRDRAPSSAPAACGGAELIVLCDVRTPFEDAARVFAPQKGADPDQVRRLTARLHALGRRWARDPRGVPMTGAAGGLSGGLWAVLGADLVPGAAFVLDAVGFDARMRAARAVVTGEGRLDSQSLAGKLVSEVATRARQAGVPCHAIVGTRRARQLRRADPRPADVREAGTCPPCEPRAGGWPPSS